MADFPLMLYKAGADFEWDGRRLTSLIVDDAEGKAAAEADGWLTAADVCSLGAAEPEAEADAPRKGRPAKA